MTNHTLPPEAIEAAIDALVITRIGDYNIEMPEFRKAALSAVKAAAPFIAEAVLNEAADQADEQEISSITPGALRRRAKSYRTTK